ncbi:hypothetical protein A464_304 [Salmonella bongori N268-08]|uniref:Uncharacterized protein n=1 Tax=Salmonella bongori N268-08 TaxID=1197719 RepID=S5N4U0_SALBN|nr:hypothetical protein A464_304 [Salmonella bongori N268-08]
MSASHGGCLASSRFCETSLMLAGPLSLNKLDLPTMASFTLSDTE